MAKNTTKKIICSITGDWTYCTDERFEQLRAKFGSIKKLVAGYQSRAGTKLVEALMAADAELELEAAVEQARADCQANPGKNKIFCIITGERMYISDARMAKLQEKGGCDEQAVRDSYRSRVAKRLEGTIAQTMFQMNVSDLDEDKLATVHEEIREMAAEGKLPAPAAPKGSVTEKPAKKKTSKKTSAKKETVVVDTNAEDIYRKIADESSKDRKNRIRREKRALAKAA